MPSRSTQSEGGVLSSGWTWGKKEISPSASNAYAKESTDVDTGRKTYWVKVAVAGPERGLMYNPTSPSFSKEYEGHYVFRKVSEQAFKCYMRFLETRNPLYARQAERNY
jgi:hypothetical protein